MSRFACLALTAALTGCSTRSNPPLAVTGAGTVDPGAGGAGAGGDAGACGFASSPTSFTLPTLVDAPALPFSQLSNKVSCTSGGTKLDYSLADMNGDGQPDLVVTSACSDPTVGVTAWLVYFNTGSGFASSPTHFRLPPAPLPAGCATASVFDVNGDLVPDYVVTSLCNDATVGWSRWMVYRGSPIGFAQTAVPFALPPGYSAGAFVKIAVTAEVCGGGTDVPAFSLFDINGDGTVDFVITQSCGDATIGTTAWQVYTGSGSGAAQTSSRFALPTTPAVTSGAFSATSASLSCTTLLTRPAYDLLDFDVDGKIDLIATQECTEQGIVGTSRWLWYRNDGQGFAATPATIALPTISGAPSSSFAALSGSGNCANGAGAPSYSVADVNGDATLDLLVTRDCSDALTGVSYWQVFPSGSLGFTSPARRLTLPSPLKATSATPAGLSGTLDCTSSRPAFTTTYLAATLSYSDAGTPYVAGFPLDMVVTADCSDSTVGNARWLLFPASCP